MNHQRHIDHFKRRAPAWQRAVIRILILAMAVCFSPVVRGQSNISQNNLLQNGGFDSGGTDWSSSAGGVYYYTTTVGPETDSILSIGWWTGANVYQDTGATLQPGIDYVMTVRATPATTADGVFVSLAGINSGNNWTAITNAGFTFSNPTTQAWQIFSAYISSNAIAPYVGESAGVACGEGGASDDWLWVDWVQLAPAIPQFINQPQNITNYAGAPAMLSVSAIGAVTNSAGPGSVITYQWYLGGNPVANATNATLVIPALDSSNGGNYYVVATSPFGSNQSSNATLVVLPPQPPQYSAAVNPNLALVDDFDGWGTSLCWWANVTGGYSNRNDYASLAFTTLGLNIVRYNIGGGENPGLTNTMGYRAQMQGFEPANGIWNWNADANQRWMLKQAVALGANHVVAFANSPPWWMTVSGSVTGSTNGTSNNLQTGYENTFAQYLSTVISNLTILDGVKFDLVTPMNEPASGWWVYGGGQEGCHMGASQQNRAVNDLRTNLTASRLTTGIDASEDNDEQDTINDVNSYNAAGEASVTLIASHTYGVNNPAGLKSLATSLGKPLWISEYGDGDASGLTMARRIHDDITQTGARAWIYWQVVDTASGWGFLYNPLDGSGNTNYSFNEKFYIMWQFSHFIRPGFQIISSGDNNSLAAYDATNHNLIIVAQNDSANGFSVAYTLGAFTSTDSQAGCWRTSANESGNPLTALAISNQQLVAYLAPQSVTTLVISNVDATKPIAWYPLEGNAQDASSNGNDATRATNVTYVAGKIGAFAAEFSGKTNSYIAIPRSISNSFTITCWVKTTATAGAGQWWTGEGIVDGEVAGPANDFGLVLVGNAAGFGIGTPDTTITSTTPINDGQWHHLAAMWDSFSGQMQLYVDGGLQTTTIGPTGTRSAPPSLRLGSLQPGYSYGCLAGTIDDVRLFGRTLSAAEVIGTMNYGPALATIPNATILAGRILLITNTATDPDLPETTLTWALPSAPAGAVINGINPTNGLLSWRPTMAQSPATNTFNVVVTANGTPPLSATQSITVVVQQPAKPVLSSAALASGIFSLTISGNSGPDYVVQATTNLTGRTNWMPVFTNTSVSPPFRFVDSTVTNFPHKFYRTILQP